MSSHVSGTTRRGSEPRVKGECNIPGGKVTRAGATLQTSQYTQATVEPMPGTCQVPEICRERDIGGEVRQLEDINLPALLFYGSAFGVVPRATYGQYAPLGTPGRRSPIRRNSGKLIFSSPLIER